MPSYCSRIRTKIKSWSYLFPDSSVLIIHSMLNSDFLQLLPILTKSELFSGYQPLFSSWKSFPIRWIDILKYRWIIWRTCFNRFPAERFLKRLLITPFLVVIKVMNVSLKATSNRRINSSAKLILAISGLQWQTLSIHFSRLILKRDQSKTSTLYPSLGISKVDLKNLHPNFISL